MPVARAPGVHGEARVSALREKQSRFAVLLAHLIVWIDTQGKGWAVTLSDGGVTQVRKVQLADGTRVRATDREHMAGSLHYQRLAQDLNLFVNGQLITSGADPAWKAIGAKWKSMAPDAAWGGDFASGDANHVSLTHGGKS